MTGIFLKKAPKWVNVMFWVIVAAMAACVILVLCFLTNPTEQRDSLVWAQELTVPEIMSAELVVLPQAADKQYRLMSEEEFPAMVKLINQSKGKYLTEHEDLNGGSTFFYITLKDGTEHSIGNIGNTYLVIDGDYYEARYRWLTTWDDDFGEGNAPLPEDYFVRQLTLDDVIELAKKGEELDWDVLEDDARVAYLAFLSGEVSLLEDVQLGQSWVDFFLPNSELEYVFMDLDGDDVSELLIQWTDSPESLNAVFDYYDGKLICWNFDSVEMSSLDYPLQNGTIVHQYDYSGTSNWTGFRYLPDGEREELFNLFARYEVIYEGDTSPVPYYEIDGAEVDQITFESQLEERITGQRLDRSEWMALNSNL